MKHAGVESVGSGGAPACRCGGFGHARPGAARGSLPMAAIVGGIVGMGILILPGLAQPNRAQPGDPPSASQHAQPDRPDGRPGRGGPRGADGETGAGQPAMTAADLRARLQRRLDDVRLIGQRLEQGIAKLDAGAAPDEVMRDLFAPGLPRGWEGGGGWRGGGGEHRGPLTDEERERVMALIQERMPRVAAWIEEERTRDPSLIEAVATRLAPQIREIERLRERDPEGARVRTEELIATIGVMRATRLYRAALAGGADTPQAIDARTVLRDALVAQFEARLAARQHEVAALSRRLDSLREDIDAETTGREQLIDAAIERISQAAQDAPSRGERDQGP